MQTSRIEDLIKSALEAKDKGATNFECLIDSGKSGDAWIRCIEFTRVLTEKEIALNEIYKKEAEILLLKVKLSCL